MTKIDSLKRHFQAIQDPRIDKGRLHPLSDIIVTSICAIIAGAEGPSDIKLWATLNESWLRTLVELPNGVPSKDTFRRVLGRIDPQVFQECFMNWLKEHCGKTMKEAKKNGRTIAIDGKTMRRSGEPLHDVAPLHIVSAWCSELRMTLGQIATEEKSNEITAIPELLDQIDIKGDFVSIDAMGCQKKIATKIVKKKGDYALAVKENQPTLYTEIVDTFAAKVGERAVDADVRQWVTSDHGHGRDEVRYHYVDSLPRGSAIRKNWTGAKAIGMVVRESQDKHGNSSIDCRYYLLSRFVAGERFATIVRSHWGIENTCHWVLDVVFNEDQNRTRDRTLGNNLSFLKRFAIGMIGKHPNKASIKGKRKMAGWNTEFLRKILELQAH